MGKLPYGAAVRLQESARRQRLRLHQSWRARQARRTATATAGGAAAVAGPWPAWQGVGAHGRACA
eukprot:1159845-Pelagomonas_calceolata.AAC.1